MCPTTLTASWALNRRPRLPKGTLPERSFMSPPLQEAAQQICKSAAVFQKKSSWSEGMQSAASAQRSAGTLI